MQYLYIMHEKFSAGKPVIELDELMRTKRILKKKKNMIEFLDIALCIM